MLLNVMMVIIAQVTINKAIRFVDSSELSIKNVSTLRPFMPANTAAKAGMCQEAISGLRRCNMPHLARLCYI